MRDVPDSSEEDLSFEEQLSAINLVGKDLVTWEKRKGRFFDRLRNSVKDILGKTMCESEDTIGEDIKDAVDSVARHAMERLKGPALVNLERQANIKLKLAQAREVEARARLKEIEANVLEEEINRKQVLESQELIDRLIIEKKLRFSLDQSGELTIFYKRSD